MKPTVYIETSIISYLTAKPSNDIRSAAWQSITADWWDNRGSDFDLFISEFVVVEASRGNEEAAARRLAVIEGMNELQVSEDVRNLAKALINEGSLPSKAEMDAFHVAVAAVNGIDYMELYAYRECGNAT